MKLIKDLHIQWNGKGTELWALSELKKIQTDEQLKLFEGEDV